MYFEEKFKTSPMVIISKIPKNGRKIILRIFT
jgi:hypothetical protein